MTNTLTRAKLSESLVNNYVRYDVLKQVNNQGCQLHFKRKNL